MEDKSKTVNINKGAEKLSYEQLEAVAHQLSNQAKQLAIRVQELETINLFNRLNYLFKVIENSSAFNNEFVLKCKNEIEDLMTIPEEETKSEDE